MGYWIDFTGYSFLSGWLLLCVIWIISLITNNENTIGTFKVIGFFTALAVSIYLAKRKQSVRREKKIKEAIQSAFEQRGIATPRVNSM